MKKLLTTIALSVLTLGAGSSLLANHVLESQAVSARPAVVVPNYQDDPLPDFAEPHLVFHYYRNDGNYAAYALWVWGQNEGGSEYQFAYSQEDYGKYLYIPVSEFSDQSQVNFLIKSKGSWDFQTPDANIQYSNFTLDPLTNAYHFYLLNGYTTVYASGEEARANQVFQASFSANNKIEVITNNEPSTYKVEKGMSEIKTGTATGKSYSATNYTWSFTIDLGTSFVPEFTENYNVEVSFTTGLVVDSFVGLEGLYDDPYFAEHLTYDGDDLGVTYSPNESVFRAWAPTVRNLELRIYDSGTPVSLNEDLGDDTHAKHNFVRGDKGVWSVTVSGNLHGKYYTFYATHAATSIELTDPYAKSAGINGVRGMIVDFSQTNPTGWEDVDYSVKTPTQIVPYELHVADLTADETWNGSEENRKKFLGLIEEGTTYSKDGVEVKTGFDHITELGINALQIIPFYDQNNDERNMDFNWGYNPHNYDVLEGGYSSNPYDGLVRIREFKQVVQAYAAHDIRIIMDVVYNHVASLSAHSFSKLVPGYYFRYTSTGSPDNSSGVGNVTASERIMMERFMRDSTAFWVSEYKIGGFRFDLMGLHTQQAMNTLMANLKTIREDIIVFGEAWSMDGTGIGDTLATQPNMHKIPGVGAFNDQIRDSFVSNASTPSVGWVQMSGGQANNAGPLKNKLSQGVLGKIFGTQSSPDQTVNYAAAHDNYTLFDKLTLAAGSLYTKEQVARQSLQTDSVVLLSQGVSFIHAGSEMLRSKPTTLTAQGFDYNSYQSSYEVNSIKWDEKVDNLGIFTHYQTLINIKTTVAGFQYMTHAEIEDNVTLTWGQDMEGDFNDNVMKLVVKSGEETYTVYFYTLGARLRINDLDGQQVVLDTSNSFEIGEGIEGEIRLDPNTTLVTKNFTPTSGSGIDLLWLYIMLPSILVGAGIAVGVILIVKKRKIIV